MSSERSSIAKPPPLRRPKPSMPAQGAGANYHWDMKEVAPVQTHHTITVNGRTLRYTATAGRMPIKDATGKIDAEMFFVAYTLDGADPAKRPLTFSYNGGPGSASIWLHMGALGPRTVVLQPEGWMPEAPYRLHDNPIHAARRDRHRDDRRHRHRLQPSCRHAAGEQVLGIAGRHRVVRRIHPHVHLAL